MTSLRYSVTAVTLTERPDRASDTPAALCKECHPYQIGAAVLLQAEAPARQATGGHREHRRGHGGPAPGGPRRRRGRRQGCPHGNSARPTPGRSWAEASPAVLASCAVSPVRAIRSAISPATSGAANEVPSQRAIPAKFCTACRFGGSW